MKLSNITLLEEMSGYCSFVQENTLNVVLNGNIEKRNTKLLSGLFLV